MVQKLAFIVIICSLLLTISSTKRFDFTKKHRRKMKILRSIRDKLQIVGMSTHQSMQNHPFNARNLTSLLFHGINITCNIGFLVFGSKELTVFTDSLFLTITAILTVSIFINLTWRMRLFFEFIDNLEDIVERSK